MPDLYNPVLMLIRLDTGKQESVGAPVLKMPGGGLAYALTLHDF